MILPAGPRCAAPQLSSIRWAAAMRKFVIENPDDRNNPLQAEASATEPLIYHGTNSTFSPHIEQHGICPHNRDESLGTEIRAIVAGCETLYYKPDGYAAAKGFSQDLGVYCSISFHSARGYARNTGGERIDGALRAEGALLSFINNTSCRERMAAHWEGVLKQHGPHPATERVLANLRDNSLIRQVCEQVEHARSVLVRAVDRGYPVVYAVRADREIADSESEPFGGIRLDSISVALLEARVDYPNGISAASE